MKNALIILITLGLPLMSSANGDERNCQTELSSLKALYGLVNSAGIDTVTDRFIESNIMDTPRKIIIYEGYIQEGCGERRAGEIIRSADSLCISLANGLNWKVIVFTDKYKQEPFKDELISIAKNYPDCFALL